MLMAMGEPEECPCWTFEADPENPTSCWCGDPEVDHDDTGNCRVQHPVDGPYDPAITERALRMVRHWEKEGTDNPEL